MKKIFRGMIGLFSVICMLLFSTMSFASDVPGQIVSITVIDDYGAPDIVVGKDLQPVHIISASEMNLLNRAYSKVTTKFKKCAYSKNREPKIWQPNKIPIIV